MASSVNIKNLVKSPKRALVLLGFLLAASYMTIMLYTQAMHVKERFTAAEIVTFKHLDDISNFKSVLKSYAGSYDLSLKDNVLMLPPAAVESFILPYSLSASWSEQDQSYRDITWTLDKKGVEYLVTLDGFDADDTVSISFNDEYPFKDLPLDWSGKIEIPAILHPDKDFKICVDVAGKDGLSFCHHVVGQKGGVS